MSNHIAEEFTDALLAIRELEGAPVETADPAASRIESLTSLVLRFLDWSPSRHVAARPALAQTERLAA